MDHPDVAVVPVRESNRAAELLIGRSDSTVKHQVVVVSKHGFAASPLEVFNE